MTQQKSFKVTIAALMATAILGLAIPAFANPMTVVSQKKGGGGGGHSGGGGQRGSGGGAQVHARSEGVRTQNFVSRTQGGTYQKQAPVKQSTPSRVPERRAGSPAGSAVLSQRKFTKTTQGRVYDNGLVLRHGVKVTQAWEHRYFPRGFVHFPFYRPTFVRGSCFISPFGFYFGICAPFIDISVCGIFPPPVVFIDVPIYSRNTCTGYPDSGGPNIINDPNLDQNEPGLNAALDELTETFQSGNIDGVVSLVNPNMRVAVFERGKYQYSLEGNDFVDMTRDAIGSTQTISFTLQSLRQRTPGVFCCSGTHTYTGQNGKTRTVYVSFVLQDLSGLWTLTQVGTSPDIIQKL